MVRAEFATTKNPEIIGEMQEGSCADGGGGGLRGGGGGGGKGGT